MTKRIHPDVAGLLLSTTTKLTEQNDSLKVVTVMGRDPV
jgi:hypothetical protein